MCFILLSLLEELPECVAAADTANICIVTFDRKVCLHNRFTGTQLKIILPAWLFIEKKRCVLKKMKSKNDMKPGF